MPDFSKYFTDPSAEVYQPDATESAMWQQSSTNPFAVLHAIAARRNANSRREQYGEQLAAHDERSVSGGRQLMRDEHRYNTIAELIKKGEMDAGTAGDLADLRTPGNSRQLDNLSQMYEASRRSGAFKDMGAGSQSFAAAGKDPNRENNLSDMIGVGELADVATTGERDSAARGQADGGKLVLTQAVLMPDGSDSTDTFQQTFTGPNRYVEYDMAVKRQQEQKKLLAKQRGASNSGIKTNAGSTATTQTPPINPDTTLQTAPVDASQSGAPAAAPKLVTSVDELRVLPPEQKQVLNSFSRGHTTAEGYVFKAVPNTTKKNPDGSVSIRLKITGAKGVQQESQVRISPDGKTQYEQ